MPECEPRPKQGRRKAKPRRGRARPEEPLALHCSRPIEGVCNGWVTQRHHILRRSQGGTDEAENTLDLCTPDHDFVHANPEWAYANGYLQRGHSA